MAIGATMVWEVRPTNGDNTFGGGYDSGVAGATTDYSQQNSAQLSLTDLVSTATTTITSLTGGFTSAMIGNVLRLNSGTGATVGFYTIITVPDTNTITVDRASGTYVDGAGKVGGAAKSFHGQGTTTLMQSVVSSNTVYVKKEAWDESVTFAGSFGPRVTIEGYNTARGDGATEANRPINDRNSAGVPFATSNASFVIKYLCATRSNGVGFNAAQSNIYIGCSSYNNPGAGYAVTIAPSQFDGCEAHTNGAAGFSATTIAYGCLGCYSHDNTGAAYTTTTGGMTLRHCIGEANASHGCGATSGPVHMNNCTFNGNTGASTDGLNLTNMAQAVLHRNNIFSNNGRNGATGTSIDEYIWADHNCFYGNATAARSNYPTGPNDVTTDPTFTNAAGGNFAVGTNMKALGFPGAFPGGTSTGYMDIGAVQRQEAAAATAVVF